MANTRNGNTIYVDTVADVISNKSVKVSYIVLTATSANAEFELQDIVTSAPKGDFNLSGSKSSQVFDFSRTPLLFPNGIKATVVTNCTALLVLDDTGV